MLTGAGLVFDGAHGVEHGHVGHAPTAAEEGADPAGEPVVRVDRVVSEALPLLEGQQAAQELRQVGVDVILGEELPVARLQMDNANVVMGGGYLRVAGVVPAREDVDLDPATGHLCAEHADVDVHAARLLVARREQGAAVDADNGDALRLVHERVIVQ